MTARFVRRARFSLAELSEDAAISLAREAIRAFGLTNVDLVADGAKPASLGHVAEALVPDGVDVTIEVPAGELASFVAEARGARLLVTAAGDRDVDLLARSRVPFSSSWDLRVDLRDGELPSSESLVTVLASGARLAWFRAASVEEALGLSVDRLGAMCEATRACDAVLLENVPFCRVPTEWRDACWTPGSGARHPYELSSRATAWFALPERRRGRARGYTLRDHEAKDRTSGVRILAEAVLRRAAGSRPGRVLRVGGALEQAELRGERRARELVEDPADARKSEVDGVARECAACSLRGACGGARGSSSLSARPSPIAAGAEVHVGGRFQRALDDGALDPAYPASAAAARLRDEALDLVQSGGQEVTSKQYVIEKLRYDRMNGSVEWQGVLRRRRLSSPLFRAQPPFTVRAHFAGRAEAIGFAVGDRHVACAMTNQRHALYLHVNDAGAYVLLRDGEPAPVIALPGRLHPPPRLRAGGDVCLLAYGIGGSLITNQVKWWEGRVAAVADGLPPPRFSVIVVCAKFSRRLQVMLGSLARQEGIDPSLIEVLVPHVPGLDGTEDVLESSELAWPRLRIVRLRFGAGEATHKGRMINAALLRARGARVVLTDADIVFPKNLFATLDARYRDDAFVGVAGRKMLDRRVTARVLVGEIDPVRDFDDLVRSKEGDLRLGEAKGKPIGYFQCVQAPCLTKVKYRELSHFEGADGQFADDMIRNFGPATIADDLVVLHLDHDGSRWYGTQRHF